MTITQPNPSPFAKPLDVQAIATILCQHLPQATSTKVSLKESGLNVLLESTHTPDRSTCVDVVRRVITDLGVESIRRVNVYGREVGDDFPDWQDKIEITPKPTPSLTELAQQGDLDAIQILVNQWLNTPDQVVKVSLKKSCLRVMIEATEFPDPSTLSMPIFNGICALGIQNCQHLKVSGREPGDDFPAWQQDFELANDLLPVTSDQEHRADWEVPFEVQSPSVSVALANPQPSQLDRARQGDAQAITEVLNYLLQSKGLRVGANVAGECLLIKLQAEQTPDQEQTTTLMQKTLSELKLGSIKQAKLYARRYGSTFTAWTQELNLEQGQQKNFWDAMMDAVSGTTGMVGDAATSAGGAIVGAAGSVGGAITYTGGAVAGTVAEATGAMGNAVTQAGGAIASTAVGVAGAIGSSAMQATDGVGYVLDMITHSPQLQDLSKVLKVDWLLAIVDRVDIVQADTHVKNLKRSYPHDKPADIAHRIMVEKALYVGASGFASSLMPGFAAAMFAVDVAATMALQAEMIYQIAAAYGLNLQEPSRKGEVLAIFGMALGGSSALKAGLGFARNIPAVGAVIGASSNAVMLYTLGYAACRFYETKLAPAAPPIDWLTSQAESERYLQCVLNQQIIMDQVLVHLVLAGHPGKSLPQILPELQKLKLSPASLDAITRSPKNLPPLEVLLDHLSRDFAAALLAQCQKVADSDGVVTPQEAKLLNAIRKKFSSGLLEG